MPMLNLRRIVSSESWVPEIDGLRFVAILAVLLFHCQGEVVSRGVQHLSLDWPRYAYLWNNFDRGVLLFFVISGFVLARPFYQQYRLGKRRVVLSQYFLRRLTRLEPPYLICLAIYFTAGLVVHTEPVWLLRHTLVSALYLHNLIYPKMFPVPNFVTWSLEVEVQFYILAPLLGQVFRIERRWLRRAVLLGLTLAGCIWSSLHTHPPVTILTFAGFFPAGFLLADLFDDPDRTFAATAPTSFAWDALGLLFWMTIFLLPPSLFIRGYLPFLIVPAYLTAFRGTVSRWLFRTPLLTTIGGMCYSLYLLHPLVMSVAFRKVKFLRIGGDATIFVLQTVLLLISILAVGLVYFVLIERPCMNKRWPQELAARLRGWEVAAGK